MSFKAYIERSLVTNQLQIRPKNNAFASRFMAPKNYGQVENYFFVKYFNSMSTIF
jgi:hypothetical protein